MIPNSAKVISIALSLLVSSPLSRAVIPEKASFTPEKGSHVEQNKGRSMLSQEEAQFIEMIANTVQQGNQFIDYQELIKQAPTYNKGAFWYEAAVALSSLPNSNELDIRENGSLRVSLDILDKLLKSNARFPQIWAQKIIVLNYLAHSHWSMGNALSLTTEVDQASLHITNSKRYASDLLTTTQNAVVRFPDDNWFIAERDTALEDFAEWVN